VYNLPLFFLGGKSGTRIEQGVGGERHLLQQSHGQQAEERSIKTQSQKIGHHHKIKIATPD